MRNPSAPPGYVVYAVGDIHGRADLLRRLLGDIADDARGRPAVRRVLVFLGDYVDRGAQSRQAIDILLGEVPPGFEARFLKGNHEQLMLGALDDAAAMPHWLMNGGDATLASYGIEDATQGSEQLRARFAAALPAAHQAFLGALELYVAFGDYLFVHAGLRPGVPLERQNAHDLLWIREDFLNADADFGVVVVHGHTPLERPVVRANRIGIDTLAWASGRLTAVALEGAARRFLTT